MRISRRTLSLVPLAALLAGCGPSRDINANLQGQPANVLLGGSLPSPSAAAPLPNINPMSTFPGFLQPPPPVTVQPLILPTFAATPTPNACPTADPRGAAERALGDTPQAPPASASYHFRQAGQISFTAPKKLVVPATPDVVRTVEGGAPSAAGTWTYQTSETDNGVTQVTKFLVDPQGVNLLGFAQSEAAGLYITEIDGYSASGNDQFTPDNPIQILAFPAATQVGSTFNVDGVDGVHQKALKGTGTVVGSGRVDACGKVIYAYQVHLTAELLGPATDVNLDAVYWIAPQYGAISVQDSIGWATNPNNASQYTSKITATISQLPTGGGS
jgi:hypothetical protein